MKLIATIPYDDVNFRWVSNHWDIHLNGICEYQNQICEFKTIQGEGHWTYILDEKGEEVEEDEYVETIPTVCEIYELTEKEKKERLSRQRKFEICVGYHWTYPYRKTGERPFRIRNPKWFYRLLFNLYYFKQMYVKK